jgi:multidrug efflux pump subunit AcrA (membrane-fusion protein)
MSVVSYVRTAASPTCVPSGSTNRGTTGAAGNSALSLTQAQSQLVTAKAAVAATTLKAPQAGTVQSMDVVVGALPGSPAVVLRADGYQVVVSVAEQDAPFIKVGQVGTVSFSAINASSPAKVVQAATSSSTSASSGSVAAFSVIFSVTEPPSDLLPGMSASVSMVAVTRKSVLTVPTTAIQSGDVGYFVRILQDGQPVNRPVQLGLSTTSLTEITKGLALGAPVITAVSTK